MKILLLAAITIAFQQTPSAPPPADQTRPTPSSPTSPPPRKPPLQGRAVTKSPSSDGLFDPYPDRSRPNEPEYPPLEDRQNKYLEVLRTAQREGRPEPNPSVQFLMEEVTVIGYLKVENVSYVLCQSGSTMFRMKVGDRFYNGHIKSIVPQKQVRNYDPYVKIFCAQQVTPKKTVEKILVGAYGSGK